MTDIELAAQLANRLEQRINDEGQLLFTQLMKEAEDILGRDDAWGPYVLAERGEGVVWADMGEMTFYAVLSVLEDLRYDLRECSPLWYMLDGWCPKIPIARQPNRRYKRPHWAPKMIVRVEP